MGRAGVHGFELSVAGATGSAVHRLDPRAKLLGLLAVSVVAVSAPPGALPVFAGCAAVLAAVAAAARVPAGTLAARATPVLVLVLPVALVVPLVREGGAAWSLGPLTVHEAGLEVLGGVAAKTAIGVGAAVLLGATTAFGDVVRGLERMGTPRLVVVIATLMSRYVVVVADEVRRTAVALGARAGRPRTLVRSGVLGRLVGTLFLRSHARGERVHLAMLARGYDGTLPHATPLVLRAADVAFCVAVLVALVPLRVLAGAA